MCPPSSCYNSQIAKKRKSFNKTDESKQKIWLLLDGEKTSMKVEAEPHRPVGKRDKQMEIIVFQNYLVLRLSGILRYEHMVEIIKST